MVADMEATVQSQASQVSFPPWKRSKEERGEESSWVEVYPSRTLSYASRIFIIMAM